MSDSNQPTIASMAIYTIKQHGSLLTSEIAARLNLKTEIVRQALKRAEKDGKVKSDMCNITRTIPGGNSKKFTMSRWEVVE